MKRSLPVLFFFGLSCCCGAVIASDDEAKPLALTSPDGHLQLMFQLSHQGQPNFDVTYRNVRVATGTLGLKLAKSGSLQDGLSISRVERSNHDETYAIPVGKASAAR